MTRCVYATVLEKTQTADFIPFPASPTPPTVPGGVMKMSTSDFDAVLDTDDIVDIQVPSAVAGQNNRYPGLAYPFVTSGVLIIH